MAILHSHKLAFVHVPKTGGVAIQKTIGMKPLGHYSWDFYKKKWPGYFMFAVVRNPLDRLISSIFYAKQRDNEQHGLNKRWGIHPDYETVKDKSAVEIINMFIENPKRFKHEGFRNQWKMVCNDDGIIKVDLLIKYENLQEGFERVCNSVGITPLIIEKHNVSKHKDYMHYYNEETEKAVRDIYKKDFEILGYD